MRSTRIKLYFLSLHRPTEALILTMNIVYVSTRIALNGVAIQPSSKKEEQKLIDFLHKHNITKFITIDNNPKVYIIYPEDRKVELSVAQNKLVIAFHNQ